MVRNNDLPSSWLDAGAERGQVHFYFRGDAMVVQLTEREQSDVIRGTPLTGTVTGSDVECVVLRADLFDRVRFLFEPNPDSAIHEMAGVIADFSPEGAEKAEKGSGLFRY